MAAKPFVLLSAFFLFSGLTLAAPGLIPVAVHSSPSLHTATAPWPVGVPIRVCALRVEFQPDNVTGTVGDGTMESGIPDTLRLDPVPHNREYFQDHLRFLNHYYSTVSKGAVTLDTAAMAIFPAGDQAAYRLDHPMWHYNYNTDDELLNQRLVELFVETVAEAAADVDFTQYDAILIFHAGVGKDFNLGFDATPFDIPSAYINPEDLQGYSGSSVIPPGVTRGLILPESEQQPEVLEFGIELSLNGILIKLFGNWLGLPDLFDTATGRSGVGRWAMMDQGSGNILALVPAHPDAWSRVYMGWEAPDIVVPAANIDTVQVARFQVPGAPEIIKLPVTPREYYLIENRDADADSIGFVELRDAAGRIMRITLDQEIASVDAGFRVPVWASHYDFGIPGSGILIWHVNEDVIESRLAENRVNTDPARRGVDLVEADGAQDIGKEYGFASPGSGTELGWQEDAWHRDNADHRAANRNALLVRFADETFPAARLQDGAFTGIELTSFSEIAAVMSFTVRSRTAVSREPLVVPALASWTPADLDGDRIVELYLTAGDSLYRLDSTGIAQGIAMIPSGVRLAFFDPPVNADQDSLGELYFEGSRIGIGELVNGVLALRFTDVLTSPDTRIFPARSTSDLHRLLAVDPDFAPEPPNTLTASLYDLDLALLEVQQILVAEEVSNSPFNVQGLPAAHFVFVGTDEAVAIGIGDGSLDELWRITDNNIEPHAVVVAEPVRRSLYLAGYGYVDPITGEDLCREPDCVAPAVDWNGDGIPEGGGPFGRNDLLTEDAPRFHADTSWVIDLNASGDPDLVGYSQAQVLDSQSVVYSRLLAVSHNGSVFSGFPRAASIQRDLPPFSFGSDRDLFYINTARSDSVTSTYVLHRLLEAQNRERFRYWEQTAIINVGSLRPQVNARANWLYCWPNPASDVSNIRITLTYPAEADVRIFDLAGRKVAELRGASSAGGGLAFEIPWDVSQVESGVYIGRVTVRGEGRSEESQVKIAVVK